MDNIRKYDIKYVYVYLSLLKTRFPSYVCNIFWAIILYDKIKNCSFIFYVEKS